MIPTMANGPLGHSPIRSGQVRSGMRLRPRLPFPYVAAVCSEKHPQATLSILVPALVWSVGLLLLRSACLHRGRLRESPKGAWVRSVGACREQINVSESSSSVIESQLPSESGPVDHPLRVMRLFTPFFPLRVLWLVAWYLACTHSTIHASRRRRRRRHGVLDSLRDVWYKRLMVA